MVNVDITETFAFDYEDKAELLDFITSCRPIASTVEKTTIDHQMPASDLSLMQKYFYHFWTRRDENNPEEAWLKYKAEVDLVNREFSTSIKKGYETDRGRVYLQYGRPNTQAVRHNNMSIYPYEIWHYYTIGDFTDKRFLFYNPDQVSNDFELLHSDLRGEIYNNNWFDIMSQRNNAVDWRTETVDRNYSNTGDAELEILRDLYYNPH